METSYDPWINSASEENFEPPDDYDIFILELLERAHANGVIDNSDILSLGVGVPEIIKRLKERAESKGLDFQQIFRGFDIS